MPSQPHLDLRLPACYVFSNPERKEDGMGREGRDYWEAQLSEYWDNGLTIQEYSDQKELPYEITHRWIRVSQKTLKCIDSHIAFATG